jgi:hypothetical protein
MVPPVTLPLLLLSLCCWAPPSGPAHLSVTPIPCSHTSAPPDCRPPPSRPRCYRPGPPVVSASRRPDPPPPPPSLGRAPSQTPCPFPPRTSSSCHKKASPDAVPRSPVFLSQAPVHRASSPTSFRSMPRPPTATEWHRTAPVSARTALPPTFIGERCSELRPIATNHPPYSLPSSSKPAPCQLHRRRMPLTEHDSATPPSCQLPGEPSPPSCCPAGSP